MSKITLVAIKRVDTKKMTITEAYKTMFVLNPVFKPEDDYDFLCDINIEEHCQNMYENQIDGNKDMYSKMSNAILDVLLQNGSQISTDLMSLWLIVSDNFKQTKSGIIKMSKENNFIYYKF